MTKRPNMFGNYWYIFRERLTISWKIHIEPQRAADNKNLADWNRVFFRSRQFSSKQKMRRVFGFIYILFEHFRRDRNINDILWIILHDFPSFELMNYFLL